MQDRGAATTQSTGFPKSIPTANRPPIVDSGSYTRMSTEEGVVTASQFEESKKSRKLYAAADMRFLSVRTKTIFSQITIDTFFRALSNL